MTEDEESRIYRYTELSPKAREKAIKEVRDHKSEWLWDQPDADQLTEDFKEILYNTHGLGDEKHYTFEVYWNLSYSQGDGVCFKGQVDVGKFIRTQKLRDYDRLIPFLHILITIPNSHYCHSNGMRVDIEFEGDPDGFGLLSREEQKEIDDWYYDMRERVRAWEHVVHLLRQAKEDPYAAHRVRLEEWEARRGKGKKAWIPEPMPVYDPTNLPPIPPEPPAPSEEPPKRLRRIMDRVKVEWKRLEDLSVEFEEYMKEKVSDISKELESYGYKEIDYHSSDEFIDMKLRESPERRYPHGAKEWRPDPERPADWRPKENLGMGAKSMTPRPIISVLGELAYLRGWIFLMGRDGVRYGIMELMRQARRDLKRGPEEFREALLEPAYWHEDDPEGHTRIMRQTPACTEAVFYEVSPY